MQHLEPRKDDLTNTITSVQKDNYLAEPAALRTVRNEFAKRIRKDYESGKVKARRSDMKQIEPRKDGITNTLTSVQKDNYIAEPQIIPIRIGETDPHQKGGVYSDKAIAPTMTATTYKQPIQIKTANKTGFDIATDGDGIDLAYPQSATRRGRVGHGVAKTIPTSDSQGTLDGFRIRKLTPRECWRLMGFDDADFDKAQAAGISNTQLYKQAGNSIVVNCLEAIFNGIEWSDNG